MLLEQVRVKSLLIFIDVSLPQTMLMGWTDFTCSATSTAPVKRKHILTFCHFTYKKMYQHCIILPMGAVLHAVRVRAILQKTIADATVFIDYLSADASISHTIRESSTMRARLAEATMGGAKQNLIVTIFTNKIS